MSHKTKVSVLCPRRRERPGRARGVLYQSAGASADGYRWLSCRELYPPQDLSSLWLRSGFENNCCPPPRAKVSGFSPGIVLYCTFLIIDGTLDGGRAGKKFVYEVLPTTLSSSFIRLYMRHSSEGE